MKENKISKYEELMKKYKRKVEKSHDNKEYMILDETGFNLDKMLEFDIFNDSKLVDINLDLFEKVELIFDSQKTDYGFEFVKFTFEDLAYYKDNFKELEKTLYYDENKGIRSVLESVEFINLKGNFRMELYLNLKNEEILKSKNKDKAKMHIIEIEARYLTIEKIHNFKAEKSNIYCDKAEEETFYLDGVEKIYNENKINSLIKNLCINRKKALKLSDFYDEFGNEEYYYENIYRGIILDKKGNFNLKYIQKLRISDGLKSLLTDMYLPWSEVIYWGKTNIENEFYIVFHLNEEHMIDGKYCKVEDGEPGYGVFYGQYKRECGNEIVLVKFKEVSLLKGIDFRGEYVAYNYVEVDYEGFIKFKIGNKDGEFFTIHAKDVEVDILDDCKRFFEWPTYWNNLGNK
ncbi:MAG: hypothetical protein KH083_05505 [Intestinibacter bartlettii]|uniref:hypothetical protein n=1 Tax=Intestinibacter bartlettii TaxID=261299 RepID=UPI002431015D|nr:hypothetical protein [Intestinibacter bartlettii]MBS7147848.1 hypothetical protein [Intestinibacter bartlettii]